MQAIGSVPERYGALPRLKTKSAEDPMQHVNVPMSAPGRCIEVHEPCGASPRGPCPSLGMRVIICAMMWTVHNSSSLSKHTSLHARQAERSPVL